MSNIIHIYDPIFFSTSMYIYYSMHTCICIFELSILKYIYINIKLLSAEQFVFFFCLNNSLIMWQITRIVIFTKFLDLD